MATIAQGMITLTSVNDAFSVLLSPSSCIINADYNGKNPKLTYAYADIKVVRGETEIASDEPKVISQSNSAKLQFTQLDKTTWRAQITEIPIEDLNGSFKIEISVGEAFQTIATFSYTVVREISMLDWILDWNGTYTEISGKWIITPKIFAGSKNSQNQITGVYLGPSFENDGSAGIYGFKDDNIIFKLTSTGGTIGGWEIENGGIQTSDGYLKILSEGSIISAPNGVTAWSLKKDGSASFAKGNVNFYTNGSADFSGKITSSSGQIGGWFIGSDSLYNDCILINATSKFIGIRKTPKVVSREEPTQESFLTDIMTNGGIAIFSTSDTSYGIQGWKPVTGSVFGVKVFSLGSENLIAGWNFDSNSLYLGTKNNTARQTTAADGDITIGTSGLRGPNWYIDNDGEINFVDGLLQFTKDGGSIVGWNLRKSSFVTNHAALLSDSNHAGLFLSTAIDFTSVSESVFQSQIESKGGLSLQTSGNSSADLVAYQSDYKLLFRLSSVNQSRIAGWNFDDTQLWVGQATLDSESNFTSNPNSLVISNKGLYAYGWNLLPTGAGKLAKGNISWDSGGIVKFSDNVYLSWDSKTNTGTQISSDGVFSGKIKADNIQAGTISAVTVKCEDKWALNNDGSGYLAAKNIAWDKDGNLNVTANITVQSLDYIQEDWEEYEGQNIMANLPYYTLYYAGNNTLKFPKLKNGQCKTIHFSVSYVPRMGDTDLTLSGEDASVFVVEGTGVQNTTSLTLSNSVRGQGLFMMIGVGSEVSTIWRLFKIG